MPSMGDVLTPFQSTVFDRARNALHLSIHPKCCRSTIRPVDGIPIPRQPPHEEPAGHCGRVTLIKWRAFEPLCKQLMRVLSSRTLSASRCQAEDHGMGKGDDGVLFTFTVSSLWSPEACTQPSLFPIIMLADQEHRHTRAMRKHADGQRT